MNKFKQILWSVGGGIFQRLKFISGYELIERNKALKHKTPIEIVPLIKDDKDDKRYFYQLSFYAEFYQYFKGKSVYVPGTDKTNLMMWNLNFGYLPLKYTYDEYFKSVIKSPERALARKAIKNGYTCKEIDYDEYLDELHVINTSKDSRGGRAMTADYAERLKPRQRIVSGIGQEIHVFGCFDGEDNIVAYYMFEHFGENIFHTVKGIGHSDHLKFGVMNLLFAFSIDKLHEYYPSGNQILLYGSISYGGGLDRFKRNVGCRFGCPLIKASPEFFYDFKQFNNKYKIHGDTGLNFVQEHMS